MIRDELEQNSFKSLVYCVAVNRASYSSYSGRGVWALFPFSWMQIMVRYVRDPPLTFHAISFVHFNDALFRIYYFPHFLLFCYSSCSCSCLSFFSASAHLLSNLSTSVVSFFSVSELSYFPLLIVPSPAAAFLTSGRLNRPLSLITLVALWVFVVFSLSWLYSWYGLAALSHASTDLYLNATSASLAYQLFLVCYENRHSWHRSSIKGKPLGRAISSKMLRSYPFHIEPHPSSPSC